MKYLEQDEINAIANTFLAARDKARQVKSAKDKQECEQQQNVCLQKLRFLVLNKTRKYKQFSNHSDLEQDGFEALILALKTYNPEKGCFSWWADKYISTRISRAANAHSTIRFPLKKAKETRPYKTSTIPTMVDLTPSAQESLEHSERALKVSQALSQLPEMHQKVVSMVYGFNGIKQHSIDSLVESLEITRSQCLKILKESKVRIRETLQSYRD